MKKQNKKHQNAKSIGEQDSKELSPRPLENTPKTCNSKKPLNF